MRNALRATLVTVMGGCMTLAISGAHAQSLPKESAARVELYPIPTLTISDRQFLTGSSEGTPVTVSGEFRVAQGSGAHDASRSFFRKSVNWSGLAMGTIWTSPPLSLLFIP